MSASGHYSLSKEKTYLGWMSRFKAYVQGREPHLLETDDVKKYLSHLALRGRVSASTQNQAFNALLFLQEGELSHAASQLIYSESGFTEPGRPCR